MAPWQVAGRRVLLWRSRTLISDGLRTRSHAPLQPVACKSEHHWFSTSTTANKHKSNDNDSTSSACCGGGSSKKPPPTTEQEQERMMQQLSIAIRQNFQQGNYEVALNESQMLLDLSLRTYVDKDDQDNANDNAAGGGHPAIASAHNNMALMHKMLGQYQDAQHHYQTAVQIYRQVLGEHHASYAAALHNYANLLRTQAQMEEDLTTAQRLDFLQEAMDLLDQALRIRRVELGEDHAHTITTQSHLGGALAAHVLMSAEAESEDEDGNSVAPSMNRFSAEKLEAAEGHLRSALETSTQNRQLVLDDIKHQEQLKEQKQQQQQEEDPRKCAVDLQQATAMQNLAVFLKHKLYKFQPPIPTKPKKMLPKSHPQSENQQRKHAQTEKMRLQQHYAEPRKLYQEALRLRQLHLSAVHPEVVATKFSMAELMQVSGEEWLGDQVRREIVDLLKEEERKEKLRGEKGKVDGEKVKDGVEDGGMVHVHRHSS